LRNWVRLYNLDMAEPKTKATNASVVAFLAKIPEPQRTDAKKVAALLQSITKQKPELWSNGMIGYGKYHFKSERSSQEGDWPMAAFSARKTNLTIYLMGGMGAAKKHAALLKELGPHKVSGGACLYIKRLADIDVAVLKKIMTASYSEMKKKWGK